KIDRPAVARLLQSRVAAAAVTAGPPRGKVETALAEIWAGLLGCPVPHREASFFALGGDSLLATRLLGRMRRAGLYGGSLRELFEHPRLKDFAALLRPGAPATATAPLEPDPANRYEPFDPTDVQRAYWLGRSAEFALGAVGSHWYWEFDGADVDVDRLERAWNLLIARHEMLRAVFDADGRQRIQQAVPYVTIPVTDGGEDELAEMRERLSARIPDPGRWPLAAIEAVRQGDQVRIAFSFDFIVLDALSIVIVFTELAALYADPGAALPPLGVSFRDYLLSIAPDPADQDYWADRLAELPPPPELPLAVDPGQIGTPRFTRREVKIDAEQWKALRERAREHGVTPASVLATAYAEVLAAWSAQPSLTLNLTLFDRRDVHPDIHRILGDFTSLLLVPHRPQTGDTVVDLVRGLQERIWDGMEHGSVSAIWVLRELARRTGSPMASMPVVFTSALGVSDELAGELPFGRQIWGISQTPQVWLDCQVTE
ncbi:condensation domain-containing protein, partial [Planotetraspora sp. A-T 1434]|uniref:condensation domain-containing protein n=1 Tax=Planotetraspora sp. A-T 1434 TaxID=2979219 RepID=UPI0021C0FE69